MPVGKVFNAAENQILFSPVTAFYQGKAIRQKLEAGEVDIAYKKASTEKIQQEIDGSPAKMRAAIARAKLDEDKIRGEIEKNKGITQDAEIERAIEAYGPIFEEAAKRVAADENVDLVAITEELRFAAEQIGELDGFKKIVGEDGVLSADELAIAGQYFGLRKEEAGEPYTLSPGSQRRGADNEILAVNPKQATPSKPDFDPPNIQEIETAKELLKKSDRLSDLSGSDKKIAIHTLASDIRNLQERLEIPYDQAAVMAIAALEKKVKDEPGAFYGTNAVLDFSGLAEGEYKGIDGKIYIEDADGNLQLRD